tara:strand:+ start:684 stop:1742 length:1059 start_codon:yes stop_codon:yes gene_type:complete
MDLAEEKFLKKYGLKKDDLKKANISFEVLKKIGETHNSRKSDLESKPQAVISTLQKVKEVHSIRMRIKSPERLMEKIVRKKYKNINESNYDESIDDLIGIRILHLFKDDWSSIHDFITEHWDTKEPPIAYIRKGDPKEITDKFEKKDCQVKEHPKGYRSVHYVINDSVGRQKFNVEIQVRTLFEEGWSEIDHKMRYKTPNLVNQLEGYLNLFNRLAGNADEMGTYLLDLSDYFNKLNEENEKNKKNLEDKEASIKKLISKLEIGETKRKELEDKIDDLKSLLPSTHQIGLIPRLRDLVPPPSPQLPRLSLLKDLVPPPTSSLFDALASIKTKGLVPPPTSSLSSALKKKKPK